MNIIDYNKSTIVSGRLNSRAKDRIKSLFKDVLQKLSEDILKVPEFADMHNRYGNTFTCSLFQTGTCANDYKKMKVNSIDDLLIFWTDNRDGLGSAVTLRPTLRLDYKVDPKDVEGYAAPLILFAAKKNVPSPCMVQDMGGGRIERGAGIIKYKANSIQFLDDNSYHVFFEVDLQITLLKNYDFDSLSI